MSSSDIDIRPAKAVDLEAINRVIEAAVMTWELPERVKRLSLPGYRYNSLDLDHLDIVMAEDARHQTIGVTAWEQADSRDIPAGFKALALHGIYVDPAHHHQGIGHRLFRAAEEAVLKDKFDGLLVKAHASASGFFISQGMKRLQVENPLHQYGNRFWKSAAL